MILIKRLGCCGCIQGLACMLLCKPSWPYQAGHNLRRRRLEGQVVDLASLCTQVTVVVDQQMPADRLASSASRPARNSLSRLRTSSCTGESQLGSTGEGRHGLLHCCRAGPLQSILHAHQGRCAAQRHGQSAGYRAPANRDGRACAVSYMSYGMT